MSLTETQESLVKSFRGTAQQMFPRNELTDALREDHGIDIDDRRWAQIADTGAFGVGAGTAVGGLGLGVAEEALLQLELGRRPSSGPIIATVVAARVAEAGGVLECAADLVAGRQRATFLVGEIAIDARPGDLALRVHDGGAELFRIGTVEPRDSFDSTVSVGRIELAPGAALAEVVDEGLIHRTRALVAAYLIGIAEAATESSAEYAKIREQFGRPIGSFQAVKHRCSEMAIRAYGARAELLLGTVLLDSADPGAGVLDVSAAYLLAMQAAKRNADDNVQNHGGIGMTAEHVPGVLVKRAHIYSRLVGTERSLVPLLLDTPRQLAR